MTTLLAICLLLCGAAFVALAGRSVWARPGSGLFWTLPIACLAEAAWCAAVLVNGQALLLPPAVLLAVDVARGLAWIAVPGVALLSTWRQTSLRRLGLISGAILALVIGSVLWNERLAAILLFEMQRWSGLLLSIVGLVVLEQVARNLRDEARWPFKPVLVGVGLLFAVDLILWSVALLAGGINAELWLTRVMVNALVAALLAIGVARLAGHRGPPFRRNQTYFFNTTLALAGAYVLMMSAASWLVSLGREISIPLVTAVFSAAGLVLLSVAVFSEQYRAWLRVTLSKLFRRYRYDYRAEWLRLTAALSEHGDAPVHVRIATVMGSFVNSPTGALWLREETGFRLLASTLKRPAPATVEGDAMFDSLARLGWVHDLADEKRGRERAAKRGHTIEATPEWLRGRDDVWLIVPLTVGPDLLGFLLLGKPLTPTPLGWEQLDLLRIAARQVAGHLALERAAAKLAELHQFEALNRLSAFVMHDLRHLVAQLDLVVKNAVRHRHNPAFIDDAIETIDSSVKRMNALMETLRQGTQGEKERRINLVEVLESVVAHCAKRDPAPSLEPCHAPIEIMAVRDRLQQAIEHLVRNSQDATPEGGKITMRLRTTSLQAEVEIADTGVGMDAEFVRTRLFKPFDSTKGEQGMGLGAYEARDIVRKLGGDIHVETAPGAGCRLLLTLPLAPSLST